ncbi:aldo/keto reductase [Cohnella silvisoli]|uniref:Aldo/keto reductase n=1 Tax=Cohnella silvisoli TaxID=2873699 RepID=A0ABV1KZA2_9BACL|nr:aldo/keto reductase [Cohnella silvisoli]MCD9021787.1 aldo/keto reductase [Cohnella silvisoli]
MKYRMLGKSGLRVSVVGVGTWQFGGEWGRTYEQHEVNAILGTAKELGINLIDTAECYGDHLSESLIGESIQGSRNDWIVATKFGHHFHRPFERTDVYDAKDVVKQLELSLQALKTDYIDLYQFHSGPNSSFDQDELWDTLQEQVKAGKIRHLGISIGSNENIHQTSRASDVKAEAIQVVYNRLDRNPEKEVFPSCAEQNLGVLARVPLASGFLSGKYKPGTQFAANDVRSRWDTAKLDSYANEVEAIKREEVPQGTDMAAWALAWCLKHPAVTTVIPGCKDAAQVKANAAAVELVDEGHPQEA